MFDKSNRSDGTFSRTDFAYDTQADVYTFPARKLLKRRQRRHDDRPDEMPTDGLWRYRASKPDCDACLLKPRCCPARRVLHSVHEGARNLARIPQEDEWRRQRKKSRCCSLI